MIDGGTTASYWYGDLQYLKAAHLNVYSEMYDYMINKNISGLDKLFNDSFVLDSVIKVS